MKSLSISPGEIQTSMTISGSKSYGNRALILAALKSSPTHLTHLPEAQDFWDLIEILKNLGVKIESTSQGLLVQGPFPKCFSPSKIQKLNLGQGGTTARFLLPFLSMSPNEFEIEVHSDLALRPFLPLLEELERLGVEVQPLGNSLFPLKLKGPLRKNETIVIDSSQTSQFASAFQLIAKEMNLKIVTKGMKTSLKYFEMTKAMQDLGADFSLPLDFSAMAYPLLFALHNQPLEISNCFAWDKNQAECEFFQFLMESNVLMSFSPHLKIEPTQFDDDFSIDVSNALDLVPPLLYFLSYIPGNHSLINTRNLIFKESNRIEELKKLLSLFDRELVVSEDQNELKLKGSDLRTEKRINYTCPNDHRLVMTAYLFLKHNGGGVLSNTEPVTKSFQNFFKRMGE